jgi:hypothetical protein
MKPGDAVSMQHPDGYATITGRGGTFVGWVPNGITGLVYLLTPDEGVAVVQFAGKLLATVPVEHLKLERAASAPAA